jgi:hypothetical protein
MAYWYYAMFHSLKPFKLNDEDPLLLLLFKFEKTFSIAKCDYVNC